MKKLIFLLLLFLVTWMIFACDLFRPNTAPSQRVVDIEAGSINQDAYDSIFFSAVNEGDTSKIPLYTWIKGEPFPKNVKLTDEVGKIFEFIIIAKIEDTIVAAVKYQMDETSEKLKPDYEDITDAIIKEDSLRTEQLTSIEIDSIPDYVASLNQPLVIHPSVAAKDTVSYSWYKGNELVSEDTAMKISSVSSSDSGVYRVIVRSKTVDSRADTSNYFKVEVSDKVLPVSLEKDLDSVYTIKPGGEVLLFVLVTGSSPIYRWYKKNTDGDGELIEGAVSNVYKIPSVEKTDIGIYYVEVTNNVSATIVKSIETKVNVVDSAFLVTVTWNEGGIVSPSGDKGLVWIEKDSSRKFIFMAHTGYQLSEVKIDGNLDSSALEKGQLTVERISADVAINVQFQKISLAVVVKADSARKGSIIIVNGNDSLRGSVIKTTFFYGDTLILGYEAKAGYRLTRWSGLENNDSGMVIDSTRTRMIVVLKNSLDITANFAILDNFSLSVINGTGGRGIVSPERDSYTFNDSVICTAVPDSGYQLLHWKLGETVSKKDTLKLSIQSDTIVEAIFEKKVYHITITINESSFGDVVIDTNSNTFSYGDSVTITALPASNYVFTGWDGYSLDDSIIVLRVTQNYDLTANFAPFGKFQIKVTALEGGAISIPDQKEFYTLGETVRVTATPEFGWEFSGFRLGDSTVNTNPWTIVVEQHLSAEAAFTKKKIEVGFVIEPDNGGIPSIDSNIIYWGDNKWIFANPNTGFHFVSWSVFKGSAIFLNAVADSTRITLVDSLTSLTLKAEYAKNRYDLDILQSDSGNQTGPDSAEHGLAMNISAIAGDDYTFSGWTVESGSAVFGNADNSETEVTLTQGNAIIKANYQLKSYAPVVTFSHSSGRFNDDFDLSMSFTGGNASVTIYYTRDGLDPDTNSTKYTTPISISLSDTIKARAFEYTSYRPSETITTGAYIKNTAPTVSITLPEQTRDSAFSVTSLANVSGTTMDDTTIASITATLNSTPITVTGTNNWSLTAPLSDWTWDTLIVTVTDSDGLSHKDSCYLYYLKPLSTPAGLSIDSTGKSGMKLSWTGVPQAEYYKVYRDTAAAPALAAGNTAATSFVDTGLTPATYYWYRVRAFHTPPGGHGKIDSSDYSNSASAHSYIVFQKALDFGYTNLSGYSVLQTADSGYVVAGAAEIEGDQECFIATLDKFGNWTSGQNWKKNFGGGGDDYCYEIKKTSDNGYVLSGKFYVADEDAYLLKLTASGAVSGLQEYYGGSGTDIGYSVVESMDGSFTIVGENSGNVYLVNETGTANWKKDFGSGIGYSIKQRSDDSNFVIAGSKGFQAFLMEINYDTKDTSWLTPFNYGAWGNAARALHLTSDGFFFVGNTNSTGTSEDLYLVKTNTSGAEQWKKIYAGSADDIGYSIEASQDGGYIVAGMTASYGAGGNDVYLLNLNTSGDTLWTRTFGGTGDDEGRSVKTASDGGYVILGTTNSYGTTPSFYLIKTDGEGLSGELTE
ncbi:MAG: chitobiase/beta-hexosaminidase C-terminal domain-containing protein [Fibrobacteria bacterium]|nr:chitobiase/beta-hexosaminidase C-terminal domain-containing protein [Fibrobacteria bacterium]